MKELSKFISISKMKISFVLLYLFSVVSFFFSHYVAVVELLISTILLCVYLMGRNNSNKIMRKYLEELSLNIETATHDSVMNSPFPMVILKDTGEIIWYNNNFEELMNEEEFVTPYIQDTFKDFQMPKNDFAKCSVKINDKVFDAYGVSTKTPANDKKLDNAETIFIYYFIDITCLNDLTARFNDSRIVKGYIYIDNLDDLTKDLTDSDKTSLVSQVEKNIFNFIHEFNAVLSKAERDRYSFIVEYKDFEK